MRLAPLLPLAVVCIGSAAAQDLDHDVLVLTSGERLVGDLLDLRDGRYWLLRLDGRLVTVELRTVARVEMAGASSAPVPMDSLPLPEWSVGAHHDRERPVAVGLDLGLTQGARVRFRLDSPAVPHVDLKAGLTLFVAGPVAPSLLAGVEVAFIAESIVHPTLSAAGGGAVFWGGLYPVIGLGTGVQIDPRGPFELHLGVTAGTTFYLFAVAPDISASWLW